MLGPNDIELYTDDHVAKHLLALSKGTTILGDDHSSTALVNGEGRSNKAVNNTGAVKEVAANDTDVEMEDANAAQPSTDNAGSDRRKHDETDKLPPDAQKNAEAAELTNGTEGLLGLKNHAASANLNTDTKPSDEASHDHQLHMAPPSIASETVDHLFTHPMFLPPDNSRPDRDLGLPEQEAEDVRRLLALFVQKQEEVCRGVKKLHDGLNRAQRLRHDVLRWSKAEAHSGPNRDMSDGEDWYDKEEWGLDEDLKKGQDDEEEDTTTTGKKTRARR